MPAASRAAISPAALPSARASFHTEMGAVPDAVKFDGGPKGVEMTSLFLKPVPITRDNLNVVIDAGWIAKDKVCQGVPAGVTAVCD